MIIKSKYKTKAGGHTMFASTALGVVLSTLLSVLGAGALAALAIDGRIADSGIRIGVILTQILATALGVLFAGKFVAEKKVLTGALTCVSFCAVLTCITLLFFEGGFGNVVTGILAVLLSGAAAIVLCARQGGKSGVRSPRRKRYSR